jgi:hypothetical protein
MKKLVLLVMVLMLVLTFGACKKAAALDLGKDFKLDGYLNVNAVVSDSYSAKINNVPIDPVEGDSKLVYVIDLGITWRNTIRPFFNYLGVSGYSTENEWAMNTQTISAGVDYYIFRTDYGMLGIRGAYTNWTTKADVEVPMMMTTIHAEPQSDTWTIGLLWRF